jgi:VIT1/CCC1 family predicted Fe2+/Mn2+ transporter
MKQNLSKGESSRKTAYYAHEGDKVMESRKRPLLGLVLISGSYCLGVAALIVAMFFSREEVGVQIANVHGVPALAGFPILILTCIVGALVAIGLYKMTSWGYWLTLIYVCYLLVVPPILVGKVPSLIGNITWPLTVAVYLVFRRKQYFGAH